MPTFCVSIFRFFFLNRLREIEKIGYILFSIPLPPFIEPQRLNKFITFKVQTSNHTSTARWIEVMSIRE